MIKFKRNILLLITLLISFNAVAVPQFIVDEGRYFFADLADRVSPAVVKISVEEGFINTEVKNAKNPFAKRDSNLLKEIQENTDKIKVKKSYNLGSGVIITRDGYVVTNYHVIERAKKITVKTRTNDSYDSKVIGHDEKTDIALLKIDSNEREFPFVVFADSDKTRVGEVIVSVGSPYGLDGSVSLGLISARNRNIGSNLYDDFLQTDAAVNPGNSGGPLFNLADEMVGINTAIFSKDGGSNGVGFAIPANTIKLVINQLKKNGTVIRGWLGIEVQSIGQEMADTLKLPSTDFVLVTDVVKNSPASVSGIKTGDIILKYDEELIKSLYDLPKMVANTEINSIAKITVLRDGKELDFKTKIISTEQADSIEIKNFNVNVKTIKKGIFIAEITENLKHTFKASLDSGVMIIGFADGYIVPDGLAMGDVILQVNQQNVKDLQDLDKIVKKSKGDSLLFFINRKGNNIFTVVEDK